MLLGLGGEHPLGLVAVALALAVLLVRVLHADVLIHEELAVHVVDGIVAGLEAAVADEAVALAQAVVVAGDLGRGDEGAEAAEGVVEDLLVNHGVQVADEELGADLEGLLLVGGGFVDAQGFSVESYAIHDLGGIVSIYLSIELDEAEPLVRLCNPVLGQVDVYHRPCLDHQLPDQCIGSTLVDVANVDSSLLVLFPKSSLLAQFWI